jgi:hypothetical protein
MRADPMRADPMRADPMRADPMRAKRPNFAVFPAFQVLWPLIMAALACQ